MVSVYFICWMVWAGWLESYKMCAMPVIPPGQKKWVLGGTTCIHECVIATCHSGCPWPEQSQGEAALCACAAMFYQFYNFYGMGSPVCVHHSNFLVSHFLVVLQFYVQCPILFLPKMYLHFLHVRMLGSLNVQKEKLHGEEFQVFGH